MEKSALEYKDSIFRSLEEIPFLYIALLIVCGYLLVKAFRFAADVLAERMPDHLRLYILPWPPLVRLFVMATVSGLCLAMVIRPDANALTALIGTFAVAIGFAFKDLVSSLVAGVSILFEGNFSIGDWVRIGDHFGEVVAIDLRTIQLQTVDDDRISIPHGRVWTDPVSNSTTGKRRQQVLVKFYLDPNHSSREVQDSLRNVALTSVFLALDSPLAIRMSEMQGATLYMIRAYPRDARDQYIFASDLNLRGRELLQRRGIRFAKYGVPDGEVGQLS